METREAQSNQQSRQVPYPNIPPIIDSRATEYYGTGIHQFHGEFLGIRYTPLL